MTALQAEPKIYHWMQKEESDFLIEMHKTLMPFLITHKTFAGKNVSVGYFPDIGESSFIAVITADDSKYILKSARDPQYIPIEVATLKEWNKHGVRIPRIYEEGNINSHPYVIMEYVTAPLLCDTFSVSALIKKGLIRQMGENLRKMREVKCVGYGRVTNLNFEGAFGTFKEYINQALIDNPRLSFLIDSKYLDPETTTRLRKAEGIISNDIHTNKVESIICHMDFSVYNTFATEPITIFDPGDPRINHPYIDLAQSLLILFNLANDITPLRKEFVEGYLSTGEVLNIPVLNACLYIQGIKKLHTWVRKKRYFKAKVLKGYLSTLNF